MNSTGGRVNWPAGWAYSASAYVLPDSLLEAQVTRNSVNGATDDDEQTMYTYSVPEGILGVGDIFEIWALWENTNSSTTKRVVAKLAGGSIGQSDNTTNQSTAMRLCVHVYDASTLVLLNSAVAAGAGLGSAALLTAAVAAADGFDITLHARWTTQPIDTEFIRLKTAKVVHIPGVRG